MASEPRRTTCGDHAGASVTCEHDYDNPVRKGRAWLVCKDCGADITLAIVLMSDEWWDDNPSGAS